MAVLSVVIPAYNEEEMLPKAVTVLGELLRKEKISYELLFVDDGSGDGTWEKIRQASQEDPKIRGILADPVGSTMGGGEHSDYNIEGIGNDFIADTMDMSLVDDVIKVTDDEAFENARLLAKTEGIFAGSSSGAAMAAVRKLTERVSSGNIVTVFPDRGDRYFSTGLY